MIISYIESKMYFYCCLNLRKYSLAEDMKLQIQSVKGKS